MPADASKPAFNLSRHPDNDGNPVWSPDGKLIAFTGRRANDQVDIMYVWLQEADEDTGRRDRTLQKAIDKMKKARTKPAAPKAKPAVTKTGDEESKGSDPAATATTQTDESKKEPAAKRPLPKVSIDFDKIHDRIHRISIPDSTETGLFWSNDGKKLAFTATVEGKRGTYTVEFPDDLRPKLLTTQTGTHARWLEQGNQIVWLSGGTPAQVSATGQATAYPFRALQLVERDKKYRAAFDMTWRTMRDRYYDEKLGNRNWDAIRRKYSDMAAAAPDAEGFATVVQLMLGELNGSHLGFTPAGGRGAAPPEPVPATSDFLTGLWT